MMPEALIIGIALFMLVGYLGLRHDERVRQEHIAAQEEVHLRSSQQDAQRLLAAMAADEAKRFDEILAALAAKRTTTTNDRST